MRKRCGWILPEVLQWQAGLKDQPLLSEAVFKDHPLAFLQISPTERLVMLQNVHDVQAVAGKAAQCTAAAPGQSAVGTV